MSNISKAFWNLVEGKAPAPESIIPRAGTKILTTHGKHGTTAIIRALQDACAAAGQPQPAFTKGAFIAAANAEIDRLRSVLSGVPSIHISAPPVVASPGHLGPPTPSTAPATYEAKLAAKPTTNIEPTAPTPAAVAAGPITQASAELLAKRDFVFACWDSVAGAGRSAIACQRPTFRDDLSASAGLYPGDIQASHYSAAAAKRVLTARGLAATSRIQNGWTTAAVSEDINKIVAEALSFGLRIPGQSVKGMKIDAHSQPLSQRRREAAQTMLDDFAAALSGADDAGTSTTPSAQKAREFYERTTGREFRVGATLQPRKL
jgi:hypothetical protein